MHEGVSEGLQIFCCCCQNPSAPQQRGVLWHVNLAWQQVPSSTTLSVVPVGLRRRRGQAVGGSFGRNMIRPVQSLDCVLWRASNSDVHLYLLLCLLYMR
jgi:hypothetical protein